MLENSYKPDVIVRLLSTGKTYTDGVGAELEKYPILALIAKNVGPGVARNIKFEGHRSFNPIPDKLDVPQLSRVSFLEEGIDCLFSGEERKSKSIILGFISSDLNKFQVTITGTWEDSKGKKHCGEFHLNFADRSLPSRV